MRLSEIGALTSASIEFIDGKPSHIDGTIIVRFSEEKLKMEIQST